MRYFIAVICAVMFMCTVAPAQPSQDKPVNRDSLIAAAREIMGAQTYCALVTLDSTGGPHVRTMNPFPPDSTMTVWIATNSRSRKAEEIRKNSRVCLYYADHKNAIGYVTITGKATLVDEMSEKQKRKRAYWDQAFPDWKYLVLIKVEPVRIEVINYKYHLYNDPNTFVAPSIDY